VNQKHALGSELSVGFQAFCVFGFLGLLQDRAPLKASGLEVPNEFSPVVNVHRISPERGKHRAIVSVFQIHFLRNKCTSQGQAVIAFHKMRIELQGNLIPSAPSSDVLPGVLPLVAADHGCGSIAHSLHQIENVHWPHPEPRAGAGGDSIKLRPGEISLGTDKIEQEIHVRHNCCSSSE
jgi:hypothetical protein